MFQPGKGSKISVANEFEINHPGERKLIDRWIGV